MASQEQGKVSIIINILLTLSNQAHLWSIIKTSQINTILANSTQTGRGHTHKRPHHPLEFMTHHGCMKSPLKATFSPESSKVNLNSKHFVSQVLWFTQYWPSKYYNWWGEGLISHSSSGGRQVWNRQQPLTSQASTTESFHFNKSKLFIRKISGASLQITIIKLLLNVYEFIFQCYWLHPFKLCQEKVWPWNLWVSCLN